MLISEITIESIDYPILVSPNEDFRKGDFLVRQDDNWIYMTIKECTQVLEAMVVMAKQMEEQKCDSAKK